jgi:hypothetical protein
VALGVVALLLVSLAAGVTGVMRASAAANRLRAFAGADLNSVRAACVEIREIRTALGPLLPVSTLFGLAPPGRARAWGQVGHLTEVAHQSCSALEAVEPLLAGLEGSGAAQDAGGLLLRLSRTARSHS